MKFNEAEALRHQSGEHKYGFWKLFCPQSVRVLRRICDRRTGQGAEIEVSFFLSPVSGEKGHEGSYIGTPTDWNGGQCCN